jgi:hypothetical protein
MDPFELPEELPTGAKELNALRVKAQEAFTRLRGLVNDGQTLTDDQLTELRAAVAGIRAVDAALAAETERADEIEDLLSQVEDDPDEDEADPAEEDGDEETTEDEEGGDEVVQEAEAVAEQAASVTASGKSGTKAVARKGKTSFAGGGNGKKPIIPRGTGSTDNVGFRMYPSMINAQPGLVGYAQIAESIDAVKKGHRVRGDARPANGRFNNLPLFALERADSPLVEDSHQLVAAIEAATDLSQLRAPTFNSQGSLTAAGGWCAPSEQLYDFCEVPLATDLIALPEITIRRGGVRWPIEPDLSGIFESFEFFFTEPQLEATPPPLKECVEIPCPDEFEEIRLNAVGYCVEAGILQTQGWPELIDWFMRSITQEHFRALSRRTILDMVAGSTPVSIPVDSQIAAGSSVLNTIELMAINLRLNKGYARNHPIEGVAPNWLHAVIRADLANQQGVDTKNVTDAQINGWFAARNVSFQFVADWQTRGVGQPGNLGTLEWPGSVRVMLYPAGTWFRSLSPVIEFGIQYPRELLQLNRYTRFFTEDAYAVAKRCDESLVVTIPICPNGAYGAQDSITCNTAANEVQSLDTTGSPTGGTIALTFQGQTTAPIAYNAAASAVQSALLALSNLDSGDVTAAGGPLGTAPVTLTFAGRYAGGDVPKVTVDGSGLTGGTNPAAVVSVTTEGGS